MHKSSIDYHGKALDAPGSRTAAGVTGGAGIAAASDPPASSALPSFVPGAGAPMPSNVAGPGGINIISIKGLVGLYFLCLR